MEIIIHVFSFLFNSRFKEVCPMTLSFIIIKLSFISITVCIIEYPESMRVTINELALIFVSILELKSPIAVDVIISEISNVVLTILCSWIIFTPCVPTMTIFHVIFVFSNIFVSIFVVKSTFSMLFVIYPFAFII